MIIQDLRKKVSSSRGFKFLIIGGFSTLLRLCIFFLAIEIFQATINVGNITSLLISIWFNYNSHYLITWNDRIPTEQKGWQKITTYFFLGFVFVICAGLTLIFKSIAVPWFFNTTDNLIAAFCFGEILSLPINYLTADKITFGAVNKSISWLVLIYNNYQNKEIISDKIG